MLILGLTFKSLIYMLAARVVCTLGSELSRGGEQKGNRKRRKFDEPFLCARQRARGDKELGRSFDV